MKPLLGFVLFTLLLGQATGLAARPHRHRPRVDAADLAYQPASPTASLDDRTASWRAMAFNGLDAKGYPLRGDLRLKESQQRSCLDEAGASQALDLLRQSDQAGHRATAWVSAAPGGGAVLGLIGGVVVGTQQTPDQYFGNFFNIIGCGVLGAVGGAALGAGVGLPMWCAEHKQARELHSQALDSYNKKLFQDLHLTVQPTQGGAAMGVNAKF